MKLSTLWRGTAAGAGDKTAFVFYMGNRSEFAVMLIAGDFLLQQLEGALAALGERVVNRREADAVQLRGEDVIKAAQADILRYTQAFVDDCVIGTVAEHVVDGDNSGGFRCLLQTFAGKLIAGGVFHVNVRKLIVRRDFLRENLQAGTGRLADILQTLAAAHTRGMLVVERGGEIGDVLMPKLRQMAANELTGGEVVHIDGRQLQIAATVADSDDGQILAELIGELWLLRNHSEDYAGNIEFASLLHNEALRISVPVRCAHRGNEALLTRSNFNALDNCCVEGIEQRRADNDNQCI